MSCILLCGYEDRRTAMTTMRSTKPDFPRRNEFFASDDLSHEIEVEKAIQRWRTAPVGTKRQREREARLARAEQIRKEMGL